MLKRQLVPILTALLYLLTMLGCATGAATTAELRRQAPARRAPACAKEAAPLDWRLRLTRPASLATP